MDKVIFAIFVVTATAAGYFFGMQHGQDKANKVQYQQEALKRAETISQLIQYHTLLDLDKSDELSVLIKSRVIAERSQLEMQLTSKELERSALLADAVKMADTILQPKADAE